MLRGGILVNRSSGAHDETPRKLTFVAFPAQETHQELELGIDGGRLLDLGVGAEVNGMLREECERGFRRSLEARRLLAQIFVRLAFDRRGADSRIGSTVGSQDDFGSSGGNEGELLAMQLTRSAPRHRNDESGGPSTYVFDKVDQALLAILDQACHRDPDLLSVREARFDFDLADLLGLERTHVSLKAPQKFVQSPTYLVDERVVVAVGKRVRFAQSHLAELTS